MVWCIYTPEKGAKMLAHLAAAASLPLIAIALLFTEWMRDLVNASGGA